MQMPKCPEENEMQFFIPQQRIELIHASFKQNFMLNLATKEIHYHHLWAPTTRFSHISKLCIVPFQPSNLHSAQPLLFNLFTHTEVMDAPRKLQMNKERDIEGFQS